MKRSFFFLIISFFYWNNCEVLGGGVSKLDPIGQRSVSGNSSSGGNGDDDSNGSDYGRQNKDNNKPITVNSIPSNNIGSTATNKNSNKNNSNKFPFLVDPANLSNSNNGIHNIDDDHDDNLLSNNNNNKVPNQDIWRKLLPTRLTEKLFRHFLSIFLSDPDILKSCAKVCSWVLWSFFILSLLGTVGIDTKPLISLLSILSLTIGFAAKDILTNTFAGIFILFTRPFKRGWIISVCGYRGKVISTDIRYLRLESLNKERSEILVPLSLVYQNAITVEQKTQF